jgi:hypothetical protein
MSPLSTSLVVGLVLVAGALSGVGLRRFLPEGHLDQHTKDIVRLGAGLMATIVGLVLGLLISSAKATYDTQRDEVRQMTASVVVVDNLLDQYGAQSRPARLALRKAIPAMADRMWGDDAEQAVNAPFKATSEGQAAIRAIRALSPATDDERYFQNQALQAMTSLGQMRLVLYEQAGGRMPFLFLAVVVAWLFVLFASFSLFSPLNPTAIGAVVIIAVSAAAAIFLILEMYHPFSGLMQIDSTPLRQALAPLSP